MSRCLLLIVFVFSIMMAFSVQAERVSLTPDQLGKHATHIISGHVVAIYKRNHAEGDWKYTYYVAEVVVGKTEKGDGIKAGSLVYARYWQREWIGKGQMPPGTSGHRGLPGEKDHVKIYLATKAYDGFSDQNTDGGFNVVGPNGFEKVKNPETK